jgi:hypothetical protein
MSTPRALLVPTLMLCACGTYTLDLGTEADTNYFFTTAIDADVVTVEDCPEDLTMDWSALTTDLLGHDMDPTTEAELMRVVRFDNYTPEDVLAAISANDLPQSEISGNVDFEPGAGQTSAPLSSFNFNGTGIDSSTEVCESLGSTFMLTALTGLYQYRMLMFFAPTAGETNTDVIMDADSAALSFDATLGATIQVPGKRDVLVSWLGLTTDGQGNPFSLSNIDGLMLARYVLTVEEMETQILDLQLIADEMYTADVGGLGEFALAEALDADGNAFTSFTGEGLWLLGLFCSTCPNPAPLYLAVIENK